MTASHQVGRPPPLRALTGIRFFAALYVVLYHYANAALQNAHWSVRAFIASGPSAVSLFFVLSGAVLVYSCTDENGNLAASRQSFWRARFARIYPTYLFALLLDMPFFVAALLKKTDGPLDLVVWGALALPTLLLVHAWTAVTVFVWNTPGWSLSAEAFFYAVFPSLMKKLRCQSVGQLLQKSCVLYCAALIPPILAALTNASQFPLFQMDLAGLDLRTWIIRMCGFSPIARLPEFMMGICLGHWLRAGHACPKRWAFARATALEAMVITMLIGALVALGVWTESKPWLDSGLLAPIFALLIAVLSAGSGFAARLLSTRPSQSLGDASYATYILQEPVLLWLIQIPLIDVLPPSLLVPVFVGILIAASLLSERFIASPARRWLIPPRHGSYDRAGSMMLPSYR